MSALRQGATPPIVTVPRDGSRKPEIMWSRVDFPAPLGPSRPVTPGPRVMVMSLTATTFPYQRVVLRSSTRAVLLATGLLGIGVLMRRQPSGTAGTGRRWSARSAGVVRRRRAGRRP